MFTQPLRDWDLDKVINMSGVCVEATAYNQPLNNWDAITIHRMSKTIDHCDAIILPSNGRNVMGW